MWTIQGLDNSISFLFTLNNIDINIYVIFSYW